MSFLCGCLFVFPTVQANAQAASPVRYTLLHDSYLLDQCLVCGRPDIFEPLRGTFDLVLVQDTAPYTRYEVQNLVASTPLENRISGTGTYTRFEEFAVLQDMNLAVQIQDPYTNRLALFTNDSRTVEQPFPLLEATLTQTNGTLLQTFSLGLFAAPVREIWFSTARGFTSTNRFAPTNQISAGDLLSNLGRVVKRNIDLVGHLGIMPIVPDLGLDAVQVVGGGEILLSLPVDVYSETLGPIQHGDLLSNRGAIVKRNQELLAAFHPASTNDAGLDAFQLMPDGEILFSIQSKVMVDPTLTLSRGDILSDRGQIFMTHQQLLEKFQPADTNYDYGLDALYILPSGEIWFSVEEGFTDSSLGNIQAGDLLSSLGYRVFANQDLLARFAPSEPTNDFGLDALFVVTDTQPPSAPPQITKAALAESIMHLDWSGSGNVFQVETAANLNGPWTPVSDILPDRSFDGTVTASAGFYRARQW